MNSGFDLNGTGGAGWNLIAVLWPGDENLNTPGDVRWAAYGRFKAEACGPLDLKKMWFDGEDCREPGRDAGSANRNGEAVFMNIPGAGTRDTIFELPEPLSLSIMPCALMFAAFLDGGGHDLNTNGRGWCFGFGGSDEAWCRHNKQMTTVTRPLNC